mmetsp:Transcript_30867/g.80979  ORF Transcript_30867/g.80979 Transcript_30867/m.80979 type:complete len:87 (+) Transcript_30867:3096-3356(+)
MFLVCAWVKGRKEKRKSHTNVVMGENHSFYFLNGCSYSLLRTFPPRMLILSDLSPVERTNEANYFNVLLLPLFLPKKRNHKKGPRF